MQGRGYFLFPCIRLQLGETLHLHSQPPKLGIASARAGKVAIVPSSWNGMGILAGAWTLEHLPPVSIPSEPIRMRICDTFGTMIASVCVVSSTSRIRHQTRPIGDFQTLKGFIPANTPFFGVTQCSIRCHYRNVLFGACG